MPACSSCEQANPDGARFCNACAHPLGEPERALGEERKTVTVVFADLVGFTARAERLDPEDVRGLLSPYHAHLRDELERHGGTVEKFIGDAVMAVFGAPVTHEDDPERAVRAALAIRDWIGEQLDLQARIAVNTGETLVSVGATPARGEAMVAGDVVNTAARLQAAAPVGGVLVGEATYRATRETISYREAAPVEAKGKAEPLGVWEALAPLAPGRFERVRAPFVGRDRELELLLSILGRAREERSTQLVTLLGVPGIGKSRLVDELFRAAGDESVSWLRGSCPPYGDGVTFWALGEIAKEQAGIDEADGPAEVAGKLDHAVEALVDEPGEARWLAGELRALVGVADDGPGGQGRDGGPAAWRRFLEVVAVRGPTVLVFEDLHWADDALLDFLDELLDWLRDVPLLVVGTARPEFLERRSSWGGGKPDATTISLSPLAEAEAERLVAGLLGEVDGASADQQAILERAGGNPLFAEQYVHMLSEPGTTGELPETVHGVIAARLDALPRAEKELLQEAAVYGPSFSLAAVAAAVDATADEIEGLLRPLERKDFVRREGRSPRAAETQYAFHHALLRDVAYGQIPRRARAAKHRRAGDWLAALGRPDDSELVAHHYAEALELSRAAGSGEDPGLARLAREALYAAGERAMVLSAYSAAVEFHTRALALCPEDHPDRPTLMLGKARALLSAGGSGLSLAVEALRAFEAAGDGERLAEAATVAARHAWFAGDRPATDEYLAVALEAVADRPESSARVFALAYQATFHMLAGRFEDSIAVGEEAQKLAAAPGLEDMAARLHIAVGCARCCLGEVDGLHEIEAGIAVAEEAGALELVVVGYGNLSSELSFFGRLTEARRAWSRSLELAERYGAGRMARGARAELAGWAFLDGRWDEAAALLDAHLAGTETGDIDYSDPATFSLRAYLRLAHGDAVGAEQDSRQAADLARASDAQAQANAFCVRARVCLEAGDYEEAGMLASDLAALGPVLPPALNSPFPNLAEAAWVFRDLDRSAEFAAVLDATPIESPWIDAARAILEGELVRAADVLDEMRHPASAAYARLRAASLLDADGREAEATAQLILAERFYERAGVETPALRTLGSESKAPNR